MSKRIHKLKINAPFYQALQDGEKTFEIRRNDRNFLVGDFLHLCEWDGKEFTGRNVWRKVSYVLTASEFIGITIGFVCMGLSTPDYEMTRKLIGLELSLAQDAALKKA